MEERYKALNAINKHFTELAEMMRNISLPHLQNVLQLLEQAYRNEQRIFIMGNGGSAATAWHLALDLAKNTIIAGAPRLKAIS
jgi:D-sedoheptulose 7-phosphate isomerase